MASDPEQRMTDDEIAGALATFMVRIPLFRRSLTAPDTLLIAVCGNRYRVVSVFHMERAHVLTLRFFPQNHDVLVPLPSGRISRYPGASPRRMSRIRRYHLDGRSR